MATTQTTTTTSKQWTLNWKDITRGVLMAAIGAGLGALWEVIKVIRETNGSFRDINWEVVGGAAAFAAVSYLIKNFGTPGEIVIINPPPAQIDAVKEGTATVKVTNKPS